MRCGAVRTRKTQRWDSVRFSDIVYLTVGFGAVTYPTVRFGAVRFSQIIIPTARFPAERFSRVKKIPGRVSKYFEVVNGKYSGVL